MSNGLNKPSTRQQTKSLSERLGALEENFARVLFGINQRFQGIDQRLVTLEELVDGLMEQNGRGEIERIVDAKRLERAHALAAQERATLDQAVVDGYASAVEVAGARSIVIGKYLDAQGVTIEPGRAQLVMPGIAPHFREKLLGQGAGTSIDLPDGGKFVVVEIYEVDEAKAIEVQAKKAAAAAQAAGEVATADEQS
jgi:hypothetical protein